MKLLKQKFELLNTLSVKGRFLLGRVPAELIFSEKIVLFRVVRFSI